MIGFCPPSYARRGVRGGVFIKTSHSDSEFVIGGATTGFLYTTCVS